MKRRDFFTKTAKGAVGASLLAVATNAEAKPEPLGDRERDRWKQLGKDANVGTPKRKKDENYDIAVLGGGIAGICAAVSAARNGSKVVLVQDRPVLGGNASSEMRVHLNGVTHLKGGRPERETGVVEEMLLLNRFMNKQESWPVFDHVLYEFVTREPNLKLMVNTMAVDAVLDGNTIKAAKCWQGTTETEITIFAKQFIDCSGDGLLAASAGAEYRTGREGKTEFNERYAPDEPDGWQMGATLLMHSKDFGKPMPFEAPSYTLKYEAEKSNPKRKINGFQNGIWWVEVGSNEDIIADAEKNREKLMGYVYGVWDYIKNSGKFLEAENHAITWVQSLPGRRESRRFMGDYITSERDLTEHKHFKDAVAYGGWSLDEHCWAGIENLADPPSYFHAHFSKVYEFPFRSLYSRNISNLLFAGRNVSQTHIALSSSRVMGTCATMGQAVGTAANLCVQKGVNPREIGQKHINELQENLLRDDAFIPNRLANDPADLAKKAETIFGSSTSSGDAMNLVDGMSRDTEKEIHHWQSESLPASLQMEWKKPVVLSQVELKCDTNTNRNLMMRKDSKVSDTFWNDVPVELLKSLELEARVKGKWVKIGAIDKNKTRLIKFRFAQLKTTAIRITMNETYGKKVARLYEVRAYQE